MVGIRNPAGSERRRIAINVGKIGIGNLLPNVINYGYNGHHIQAVRGETPQERRRGKLVDVASPSTKLSGNRDTNGSHALKARTPTEYTSNLRVCSFCLRTHTS